MPAHKKLLDLLNSFIDDIDPTIRERGERYFNDGKITHLEITPDGNTIHFSSEGSSYKEYLGSITISGEKSLDLSCSCPFSGFCKHIAAATMEAIAVLMDNEEYELAEENSEDDYDIEKDHSFIINKIEENGITNIPEEFYQFLDLLIAYIDLHEAKHTIPQYMLPVQKSTIEEKLESFLQISVNPTDLNLIVESKDQVLKKLLDYFLYLDDDLFPELRMGFFSEDKLTARLQDLFDEQNLKSWQDILANAFSPYYGSYTPNKEPRAEYFVETANDKLTFYLRYIENGPLLYLNRQMKQEKELPLAKTAVDDLIRNILIMRNERSSSSTSYILKYHNYYDNRYIYELLNRLWTSEKLLLHGNPLVGESASLYFKMIKEPNDSDPRLYLFCNEEKMSENPELLAEGSEQSIYRVGEKLYFGPQTLKLLDNPVPASIINDEKNYPALDALGVRIDSYQAIKKQIATQKYYLDLELEDGMLIARVHSEDDNITLLASEKTYYFKDSKTLFYPERDDLRALPSLLKDGQFQPNSGAYDNDWIKAWKEKRIADFLNWLSNIPETIEIRGKGEIKNLIRGPLSVRPSIRVKSSGIDWFQYDLDITVNDESLSPSEVKKLIQAKGKYIKLPRRGYLAIEKNSLKESEKTIRDMGLQPGKGEMHVLQLAETEAMQTFIDKKTLTKAKNRLSKLKQSSTYISPAIKAVLRHYQEEGLGFLQFLSDNQLGGILADDMGLGKTLQCIAWIQGIVDKSDQDKALPFLVLAPKSVTENWISELNKFAPDLKKTLFTSKDHFSQKNIMAQDIIVVNYAVLRSRIKSFSQIDWQAVILDEAQAIKNPASKVRKAVKLLSANTRLAMTGTPIENRLLDLYSIVDFVLPAYLGSQKAFIDFWEKQSNIQGLKERMRPIMLRRTKDMVANELPEKVEEDLYIQLEDKQHELYFNKLKIIQESLEGMNDESQFNKQRMNVLTDLLRLRQLCCAPALIDADLSAAGSAKVDFLMDRIEEIVEEKSKCLVFSQFKGMLDLVQTELQSKGIPHFMLTGETQNRKQLTDAFNNHKDSAVFLLSIKAAGTGINLTSAPYVFIMDPWWNPAVEDQAIDRTHRIGQKNTVFAYRLIAKNTIEEKVQSLKSLKRKLSKDLFDEDSFSNRLGLEEIKTILSS